MSPDSFGLSRLTGVEEALAGARVAPAVETRFGGVVRDTDAEHRFARVGSRLAVYVSREPDAYRYRLLDSDRVDAVSLPGGRIYITRGLYDRLTSDDLLAAVLAHEMAHLETKDHFKPRPGNHNGALAKEISADIRAANLLQNAGWSPVALADLLRLVQDVLPVGWADTRLSSLDG